MRKFVLAAAIAACLLLPIQVFAASVQEEGQRIELSQNENVIEVAVTSPEAAREEVSSLQLSLKVVSEGETDIQFIPDSRLSAKIVESRYREDTKTLNIYVAGEEALFDKNSSACRLGSVVVTSRDAAVTVSVLEGSLKYVVGTELSVQEGNVTYPAAVSLNFQGSAVKPGGNESNSSPSEPGNAAGSEISGNVPASSEPNTVSSTIKKKNVGNSGAADEDTANVSGLNESGLRNAIDRAAEYHKDDYTEESYQLLLKEVAKARELLDMENVTQEELDEAQLRIENAIGMLELKSESPAGQEDGESKETEKKEDSQSRHSLSVPVIIAVIAAALAVIAAAVLVIVRIKKGIRNK